LEVGTYRAQQGVLDKATVPLAVQLKGRVLIPSRGKQFHFPPKCSVPFWRLGAAYLTAKRRHFPELRAVGP
jgi:hypothetical protein